MDKKNLLLSFFYQKRIAKLYEVPTEIINKLGTLSLNKLYDLIFNNNFTPPKNDMETCLFGLFYYIKKNYDLMKRYYLIAIKDKNSDAMLSLGYYYEYVEKNYDLMKKYYLMAIDYDNSKAMNNMGLYYQYVEKNYDLGKKYYLMAFENDNGNSDAMYNLGICYQFEKNFDLMKKYYAMAIEKDHIYALVNLKCYYIFYKDFYFVNMIKTKFEDIAYELINKKLRYSVLPKEYWQIFKHLDLPETIHYEIRLKQFILKKTGVYPETLEYYKEFYELCKIKNILPKNMMMYIAGFLFI